MRIKFIPSLAFRYMNPGGTVNGSKFRPVNSLNTPLENRSRLLTCLPSSRRKQADSTTPLRFLRPFPSAFQCLPLTITFSYCSANTLPITSVNLTGFPANARNIFYMLDEISHNQSEDCLSLNVWTKPGGGEKKSVLLWLYGGCGFPLQTSLRVEKEPG